MDLNEFEDYFDAPGDAKIVESLMELENAEFSLDPLEKEFGDQIIGLLLQVSLLQEKLSRSEDVSRNSLRGLAWRVTKERINCGLPIIPHEEILKAIQKGDHMG
ncbi:hypothetical protein ISN44_As12g033470 [Arabidopsis suecica]|uniref:Uncharacterized protein n=1 Tax=Arabidopsis suecica TaxID=45249 RepID=A0A8T1YQ49_ARASU|nr:hypothetical protein ISN44_As12g033470 [Arabidopsis suecica]